MKCNILEYTESGRVKEIEIGGTTIDAVQLRNILGIKSTNFTVESSGDKVVFFTNGYGHGVGMSQEGANQMAKMGSNYEEIIKHYYTGVEIRKDWRMYILLKNVKNTSIIRGCFMIIHSDKKVICIKEIPSNLIDEAIFILNSNIVEKQKERKVETTKKIIIQEAENIVEEYLQQLNTANEEALLQSMKKKSFFKEIIYIVGLLIILAISVSVVM